MKIVFPLMLVALLVVACKKQTNNTNPVVDKSTTAKASFVALEKAELTISGMTCAVGCAGTIQKSLAKVEGVQSVEVDFDKQLAMVEYNPSKLAILDLENTVHETADTYKVLKAENVSAFHLEDNKEEGEHNCDTNCKNDCCKDKKMDQANATASCKEKCAKPCCANKA